MNKESLRFSGKKVALVSPFLFSLALWGCNEADLNTQNFKNPDSPHATSEITGYTKDGVPIVVGSTTPVETDVPNIEVDMVAPNFKLEKVGGGEYELASDLGKKPILIAVSSDPLNLTDDYQYLANLQAHFGEDNLRVIAVNIGDSDSGVFPFDNLVTVLADSEFKKNYTQRSPKHYLINGEGKVSAIRKNLNWETAFPLVRAIVDQNPPSKEFGEHGLPFSLDERVLISKEPSLTASSAVLELAIPINDILPPEERDELVNLIRFAAQAKPDPSDSDWDADGLLTAGERILTYYCNTKHETFKKMIVVIGTLAYVRNNELVGEGYLDSGAWEREKKYVNFDISCQGPHIGL